MTESKQYLDKNVLDAARERIRRVLDDFDDYYVSFSGGKDSTLLLHLVIEEARKRDELPVDVLYIDLEAQYRQTMEHVEEMLLRDEVNAYWVCLPFILRNAVSQFQPHWLCWNPELEEDGWVREMPDYDCVISDEDEIDCFERGMQFEDFVEEFPDWYAEKQGADEVACFVGIRSDESLNRFRSIKRTDKNTYRDYSWTTQVNETTYNAYPVYDWTVEDVWTFYGKTEKEYNRIYDEMHWNGSTLHEMRICQPYGDDQKVSLDNWQKLEPETWERVVARVSGANMGANHPRDELVGYGSVELPEGHTWKSYTETLLASLPEKSQAQYLEKFKTFIEWWEEKGTLCLTCAPEGEGCEVCEGSNCEECEECEYAEGVPLEDFPDAAEKTMESRGSAPSWRRLGKCIVKNDWSCKSLSFSSTKNVYKEFYEDSDSTTNDQS